MPVRIDSKAVMVAMIGDPDTFPAVAVALDKDVVKHLAAHFKHKGMGLARLRATHDAFGHESLDLILESLDDKAGAALLKKVDPHRAPEEPSADLMRLKDLAGGKVEPQPKPEKPKKATASRTKAPALTRAGADKAAAAKGTGTRPTGSIGAGELPPSTTGATAKQQRRPKAASPKGG